MSSTKYKYTTIDAILRYAEEGLVTPDDLLGLFVSNDDYRPALMQPNQIGNYIYATDAHTVIRIPVDKVTGQYPPHHKTPDIEGVISNHKGEHIEVRYTTQQIMQVLNQIPKVQATNTCEHCEGRGTVLCSACGNAHDCNTCDGEGYTSVSNEMDFKDYTHINIGQGWFNPFFILKLIAVANVLEKDIVHTVQSYTGINLFKVGYADIFILPVAHYSSDCSRFRVL